MNWRANKFLDVIGRLKPGTSRSVAEQQLTFILRRARESLLTFKLDSAR